MGKNVEDNAERLVWDLPLRIFHWLLTLSFAGSWLTATAGVNWTEWHFRLGYFTAGLLIFRLIWGFVGPKHSRFSNFFPRPSGVIRYLRQFFSKKNQIVATGHNPVGAIMVFVLLLTLTAQVVTGLFATDDILFTGPLYGLVEDSLAKILTGWHHRLSDVLKAFVFLHIAAVIFYLLYKKQNLIKPMITGRKANVFISNDNEIPGSMVWRGLVIAILVGVLIYIILTFTPLPK